jgi:hypothetical protein
MCVGLETLLGSMALLNEFVRLLPVILGNRAVPRGVSTLADFGRGSPECARGASAGLRSDGCARGPGRLSGLLVLEVKVSLVVTCTLSIRRSSTFPLVRCDPEGALLWLFPGCSGDWGRWGFGLSLRLPPCCPDGARGCALPFSVAVLRSERDDTLAWDEEDMLVTFELGRRESPEKQAATRNEVEFTPNSQGDVSFDAFVLSLPRSGTLFPICH